MQTWKIGLQDFNHDSYKILGVTRVISDELLPAKDSGLSVEESFGIYQRLSHQDQTICKLLVQGKTLNQIACQLNVTSRTVSNHRKKLLELLRLSGTAELIRLLAKFETQRLNN